MTDTDSPLLRRSDLSAIAARSGAQHRFQGEGAEANPVLQGQFGLDRYRSGIQLHTYSGRELENTTVAIQLVPSICFSVVVEGDLQFAIGKNAYHLFANNIPTNAMDEDKKQNSQYDSFAMNLLRPAVLQRKISKDTQLSKVNVAVSQEWLLSHFTHNQPGQTFLTEVLNTHLALPQWHASPKLLHITQEILKPSRYNGALHALYLESKSIEFITEAISNLVLLQPTKANENIKRLNDTETRRKLSIIHAYLDEHLLKDDMPNNPTSLEQISDELGMSISNLQRLFKQQFGKPIFEYVRFKRLEKSRYALEILGTSIGEAAYIAGYKHTSNFSLAFKRAFGVAPGGIATKHKRI